MWRKTRSWPDIRTNSHYTKIFYFEFNIWIVVSFGWSPIGWEWMCSDYVRLNKPSICRNQVWPLGSCTILQYQVYLFLERFLIFLPLWSHTRLCDSFGQLNEFKGDLCHFHMETLRTNVCSAPSFLIPPLCCIWEHSRK